MHEFFPSTEAQIVHPFLDEIFHRLDIVVGGTLQLLDTGSIRFGEIQINVLQFRRLVCGELTQLRKRNAGECQKVLHLDPHAVSDQRKLREKGSESFCIFSVAAVHWGQGEKCIRHNP